MSMSMSRCRTSVRSCPQGAHPPGATAMIPFMETHPLAAIGFNGAAASRSSDSDGGSSSSGSDSGSGDSDGNAKCFIDYVKLFYSHATPPTRQLSMNGHWAPASAFPLHSGVQGAA